MIVGEYFVTREMAMDACEPSMEGMFYEHAYDHCAWCFGTGEVSATEIATATQPLSEASPSVPSAAPEENANASGRS